MCQAFDEKRFKIVRLPLCYLIGLFNLWRTLDKGIARPLIDNLPEDAEVVSVDFQHNPRSLEVTVCSMQFEPVPAVDGNHPGYSDGICLRFDAIALKGMPSAGTEVFSMRLLTIPVNVVGFRVSGTSVVPLMMRSTAACSRRRINSFMVSFHRRLGGSLALHGYSSACSFCRLAASFSSCLRPSSRQRRMWSASVMPAAAHWRDNSA